MTVNQYFRLRLISECLLHSACLCYIVLPGQHGSPHTRHILAANVLGGIHFAIINNSHPRIFARFRLIQLSLFHGGLLLICLFLSIGLRVSLRLPFLQLNLSLCLALPLHFGLLLHFLIQHSLPLLILLLDFPKQLLLLFRVVISRCWRAHTKTLRHVRSSAHARDTRISEHVFLAAHLHATIHLCEAIFRRRIREGLLLGEVCEIHFYVYNYK